MICVTEMLGGGGWRGEKVSPETYSCKQIYDLFMLKKYKKMEI